MTPIFSLLSRSTGLIFLLFAASTVWGQGAPKAELVLPKTAAPGASVRATLKLTFEPGLHGYQNPPTKDYMIPVKVESAVKGLIVVPKYPKGEVTEVAGESAAVYEGLVSIPVLVTMPKKLGALTVRISVSYQQCNKEACFPPDSITVTGKITVKKATKVKAR